MPLIILPSPPNNHDYSAFTDESGLSEHYMLIGGISCRSDFAQVIHDRVINITARMPFEGSLQWKHITPARLPFYIELVEQFLQWNAEHVVDFHAVVIERRKLLNLEYNDGDAEKAFNKFLYQSMYSNYRRYPAAEILRCFHGNRTSPYRLEDLREMLNSTATGSAWTRYGPFREVKYMDVVSTGPLQLADVLLGAVGFYWNTKKPVTNPAKIALAKLLHSECPADTLRRRTPNWMPHFDIWEFKLRGAREART